MRTARFAILCFCTAAAAGCSLAPHYEPPQTAVPAVYKEDAGWTQAQPQDSIPRGNWWSIYRDSTLDGLEALVETSNPTLGQSLSRYDQARAYFLQSQSQLLPVIGASVQGTANRQSDDRPLRSANQPDEYANNYIAASLSYEADLWGRVRNLVAAGKAQEEAAAADVANIRLSMEGQLADTYVRLRGLEAQLSIVALAANDYQRALELVQQRYNQGIASGLDLGRAQTQLNDTRAQIASVTAQRALAEHAIASLVGTPASNFSLTPATLDIDVPNVPSGLPSTLLQRRPDIAAAERRVAAANAVIGVARAAFFPTISLGVVGGFQNTGALDLLTAPNLLWAIGPAAAVTLFDAGAREAQVDIAVARRNEVADAYRFDVLQAFQGVEDNLAQLNNLAQAATAEDLAVEAASRTEKLSLDRYDLGAVSYLDVVTAQTAALQTRLSALDIRTHRLQSSIRLIMALGGGWTRPQDYDVTAADQ